jgi:hypothetical protein
MGWTKQELVKEAFGELALRGFEFDLDEEELGSALRKMEAMLATWGVKGIRLGYAASSSPSSADLDADSNLPDWANEAVYLNLALRLMGGYGKAPHPETRINAKSSYDAVLGKASQPMQMQYPGTLPRGAGNKTWRGPRSPFMPTPTETIDAGPDGDIDLT